MTEAFERTVAYLKERRQFDRFIGSFQGLQHRAANMYSEIEVAKSLVIKALDSIDAQDFMAPALCSMAKTKTSTISQMITNEGVQMYGGIGMTDDEEIGFFMKRARVAVQQYGSASYHLDRFATMSGY
jgi:acyl-CoA dehydrogenase